MKGWFLKGLRSFRSMVFSFQEQREKKESIKQISGSERKNFLYLEHGMTMERNDRIPFEEAVVPRWVLDYEDDVSSVSPSSSLAD